MNRAFIAATLLLTTFFALISCDVQEAGVTQPYMSEPVTLYGTAFLRGKVSSIVYNDEQGYDSTLFVYNEKKNLTETIFYLNGEKNGFCKYYYNGPNRIDLHYYDNSQKEVSYSIVEFDDRKNITLHRDYGYIYPDTTRMELLYMKQNSYDKNNRPDNAFEYYCDGIPPYKYRYSYKDDGTEVEECFLAVTGNIYTITNRERDSLGNIIKEKENMPWDSCYSTDIEIEYTYDDRGNWLERNVIDAASDGCKNNFSKRKIYYLEE